MLLLLSSPNIMDESFWNQSESLIIISSTIAILGFGIYMPLKMKRINIGPQRIIFQNYLFGSNVRDINLKEYDYYKIIQEESENGIFEAVWLIKNGRLKDSFSTYQYANYNSMRHKLNIKFDGTLDKSLLKQLSYRWGAKI